MLCERVDGLYPGCQVGGWVYCNKVFGDVVE